MSVFGPARSPGEFHSVALANPCVIASVHTVTIILPGNGIVSTMGSSPTGLTQS